MTFSEKFEYLKKTYGQKADFSGIDFDLAAQITLTDDDCHGIFYVSYLNGIPTVEPYDYRDNTVHITIHSALLEALLQGKADPVKEYLEGNLALTGSAEHALALINALKIKKRTRKATTKA